MIWRLALKDMLKFFLFYIHLILAVVVYFDFSLLLQESLEVTDQRKELIVDLRTAYVCFSIWLRTHQQPAWVNPRDVHGMTTFAGCCWHLLPIFSPGKGDYCILLLHFCSKISLKNTPSTGIQSFVPASRAVIKGISPDYSKHYRQLLWNLDITKAKGLAEFVCYNEVSLYRGCFHIFYNYS